MGALQSYEWIAMAVEVRVPTTGNAGEDAVVVELRATLGGAVFEGNVVAVLETAKAALEVEAPHSGMVIDVSCQEGDEVAEHSVLLVIGEPGEIVSATSSSPGDTAQAPSEHPAPLPLPLPLASADVSDQRQEVSQRIPISPRARLIAKRNGIDISTISGSGPRGRIVVSDILTTKNVGSQGSESAPAPRVALSKAGDATVVPVRGARKVTASRMSQSLSESAQVTLNRYVAADVLVAFNARLRKSTESHGLHKVGINDLVNLAVARVLPSYPAANSHFSWDGIAQFSRVHLGVAVDTGSALLVPVIRDAHTLSLLALADQARKVAERARAGALEMAEMENGTFTVTNLGMFGVHWFTPVLNPPQSGILGVGALHQPTPDAPALLPLSLTFDHRALDGAEAARFLAAVSDALENIDALSALLPTND